MSAQNYIQSVKDYLITDKVDAGDIQDLKIIEEVHSSKNNIKRIYLAQQFNGIPINNSQITATFKDGKIIYVSHNLESNISNRANISTPSLGPVSAASTAAIALNLGGSNFSVVNTTSPQKLVLSNGGVSQENVPVKLVYTISESGELKLAWDLSIYTMDSKNWWECKDRCFDRINNKQE